MMNNSNTLKVCISGAAGKIAYALYSSLGTGDIFGADVFIDLRLLDLKEKKKELEVLVLELEDCCFPLLKKVSVHHSPEEAFDDLDFAILLGGFARKPGMERTDLFEMNHSIFEQEGNALNEKAKRTCKVLVIANPANNNCLTLCKHATGIPKLNITCLMRLDHNRTKMHTAIKANKKIDEIKDVIVWGNHSSTVFPDLTFARIDGQKATTVLPEDWTQKELVTQIQARGGKVLMKKGISSCLAAANAVRDHIKDWRCGNKEIVSMGVTVEQDLYNGIIPKDLCVSLPVRCLGNYEIEIVKDLELTPFQKEKIEESVRELMYERQLLLQNSPHE